MKRKPALTFETARGEQRWRLPAYTTDQVRSLPASVPLVDAAKALGLSREDAYQQAADGHLQYGSERVPVRRVGARHRVRLADLMQVLGIVPVATRAEASAGQVA